MRSTRWKALGVAALVGALALSGCARGGQDDTDSDDTGPGEGSSYTEGMVGKQTDAEPKQGGSITWTGFLEPRSLDPAATIASASTGGVEMNNIYDTLMRYDAEKGELVPQLAESLEANDEFTEFTIKLRPDLKFHDGTTLDAEAVKWSMERYAAAQRAPEGQLWRSNVKSIEAVDATTLKITINEKFPTFPNMLSTGPGMIVAKASDAGGPEAFEAIGAGPFKVKSVDTGEAVTVEAFEGYWDGKPYLDTVRFAYLDNPQAAIDAMSNGDVQAVFLRGADEVDDMLEADKPGYVNMVAASNAAILSESSDAGADPRVRKALAMAVDPKVVHDRAYKSKGIPTLRLFADYSKWYNESVPEIEYNPEEAKKLLEEAKADGYSGKVHYIDGQDEASRDTALAVQAQLEAVGFEVETELLRTAADQITRALAGDYEVMAWGVSIREFDPYSKMNAAMHSEGTQVYGMPTSPEMDELLDKLKAAEPDEAKAVMAEIETLYVETVPFITWAPFAEATFWADNVGGVEGAANSMVSFKKAYVAD
ncbi:ABC transporter substrate-binding protein [Enemella sp. A6]|uniref:ABC transporter substrate-binding protein n=1 Tax=Enemella sp. A6 TaxID=3440152 RepID=UPI003EBD116B